MSTPATTPSPSLLQPTRQQIDELDALLERMLELPVNPFDAETAMPAGPEEMVFSICSPIPRIRGTEVEGEGVERLQTPAPLPQPLSPEYRGEGRWEEDSAAVACLEGAPDLHPDEWPVHTVGLASAPVVIQRPSMSLGDAPRRVAPGWLRPVLWINRVFDRHVLRLGEPGRWLRQSRGRALLGTLGIVSLATALTIVLHDWFGWTW